MRKPMFIILVSTGILLFSRCDLINPPESIPGYLHIDSFTLQADYDSFGSLSHGITDAWIIVNDKLIGSFELPATIPVLAAAGSKVLIRAGIKENGINNTRTAYPFYSTVVFTHDFKKGVCDTINPTIAYLSENVKYMLLVDFETARLPFEASLRNNATLQRTNTEGEVFEGNYSYFAELPAETGVLEIVTDDYYNIPRAKSVFLEVNYKCEVDVTAGFFVHNINESRQLPVVKIKESEVWKKIYINLGTDISNEQTNNVFRIFFGAVNTSDKKAKIFLDNIKVIHFE